MGLAIQEYLDDQGVHRVRVNYGLSLEEFRGDGRVGWVCDSVFPNAFEDTRRPGGAVGEIQIWVFPAPTGRVYPFQALGTMAERGMRHATMQELCSLFLELPELAQGDPVVGLGASWECGGRFILPVVSIAHGSETQLSLGSILSQSDSWDGYQFVGVPE